MARLRRATAFGTGVVLVLGVVAVGLKQDSLADPQALALEGAPTSTSAGPGTAANLVPVPSPATTEAATTTPSTAATTAPTVAPTTAAPTPTSASPPPPPPAGPAPLSQVQPGAPLPAPGAFTMQPYYGLGAWIDVYDWSYAIAGDPPPFDLPDIDRMAALGVQTLYMQPVRWDVAEDILEHDRVVAIMNRARANGIRVVAWYLPDLRDPANDLRHLLAIARLPIDGLGIDIESRTVEDIAVRNQRLVELSAELRRRLGSQVLSAIVLPPVVMEDVNPNYWPGHPWAALAPYYDIWQPMSYFTGRRAPWRDAYAYTAVNIDRIRAYIGQPDAVVHSIGGIGDLTTIEDIQGMLRASEERGAIGGSIYDYRTTHDALWPELQRFRR